MDRKEVLNLLDDMFTDAHREENAERIAALEALAATYGVSLADRAEYAGSQECRDAELEDAAAAAWGADY